MRKIEQILIALLLLITFSCSKNNENDSDIAKEEIGFTISFSDLNHSLKSVNLNDSFPTLDDAKQIVITIKTINGEDTKYKSEKIEIFKMNGNYFSQKLSLFGGDYKLTEFFLIDSSNNTIFATPLIGSQQAQNVDQPLPIDFSIAKDQITSISVEVLATTGLSPEDFGLVGFIFHEVPTFSFLINVSEKGQMDSLLMATIEIGSGNYTFNQDLEAIANNIVVIKAGFSSYTLRISKDNLGFEETFSIDSLKQHIEFPLTIELQDTNSIGSSGTVTDIDGNVYQTIVLGEQEWMAENLKVTKYSDGTAIQNITGDSEWMNLPNNNETKAYCWFEDDINNKDKYGAYYTYGAAVNGISYVTSDIQGACPDGWHVPSNSEWSEMENYLSDNGFNYDGTIGGGGAKIAKALAANLDWITSTDVGVIGNNLSANNSSGLALMPGGYRITTYGEFLNKEFGMWHTSEVNINGQSYYRYLWYGNTSINSLKGDKSTGRNIRCIKN